MPLNDLLAKLKTKDLSGVYLFYGEEEYTKDFYIKKLRGRFAPALRPEISRDVFGPENLNPDALYDAVNTPSFGGERKIIEITDFPHNEKSGVLAKYVNALETLPPGVAVLFIYRAGNPINGFFAPERGRSRARGKNKDGETDHIFFDFIRREAVYVDFAPEKGAKLLAWVNRHFSSENIAADGNTIKFLVEYCGNDMYVLAGEIDKLSVACAHKGTVTAADVKAVCFPDATYRVFDIIDGLHDKNIGKVKRIYDSLVQMKTKPELILGAVAGHFTDLLCFQTAFLENRDVRSVKSALGYGDYQGERLAAAVRKTKGEFVSHALDECQKADETVKGRAIDPYLAVELMLYGIMSYEK